MRNTEKWDYLNQLIDCPNGFTRLKGSEEFLLFRAPSKEAAVELLDHVGIIGSLEFGVHFKASSVLVENKEVIVDNALAKLGHKFDTIFK